MRRRLLRFVDRSAGRLVALSLALYDRTIASLATQIGDRRPRDTSPANILVIKIVGLGDTVLMLTPLMRLRRQFPEAKISILVTPLSSGILSDQPSIDELVAYDVFDKQKGLLGFFNLVRLLRSKKFDWVMDFEQHFQLTAVLSYLTGAPRRVGFYYSSSPRRTLYTDPVFLDPDRHMVDSYMNLLEPLGMRSEPIKVLEGIRVSPEDEDKVRSWLRQRGVSDDDLLIGVHPGSGMRAPSRRWGRERFAEIIRRLSREYKAKIVLTGGNHERELIAAIVALSGNASTHNSAGWLEIKQTAALMRRCRLFISNDTGPMHMSAAVGTPTIGLFGPNVPSRYAPIGERNAFVYRRVSCSPCIQIHEGRAQECDNPRCMKEITIEDVWQEILRYDLGKTSTIRSGL